MTALLCLPKEILLEIIASVALVSDNPFQLSPTSLIELSTCCKYLYHLVHKDPWRQQTLWPRAFHHRFDTKAIYRRRLNYNLDWQKLYKRRCKALYQCRFFSLNTSQYHLLHSIDWEAIWDMITEHDQLNIPHLLNYQVQYAAGVSFQLGPYNDREMYPVVLPILSLLVNYDFSITRFFHTNDSIVSNELSQFAYNYEADTLITQHTPFRYFHSWSSPMDQQQVIQLPKKFYPAQDPLSSAFHLFFTTIFAHHPDIYQAIPGCIPIPLYTLHSELFDVEFLRRYERNLFLQKEQSLLHTNIYADTGFASATQFVSESHLIEGDWIGYYTFQDSEDDEDDENTNHNHRNNTVNSMEDWFDGPMRISIKIVPLEDVEGEPITQSSWLSRWLDEEEEDNTIEEPRKRRKTNNNNKLVTTIQNAPKHSRHKKNQFPSKHLKACPLTRFEGTGEDNLGTFLITGLVDDTEEGQVTWEKNYIDSGETWEYSGRFTWPMGLCGRWGDEEYGGPWWMWKVSDTTTSKN